MRIKSFIVLILTGTLSNLSAQKVTTETSHELQVAIDGIRNSDGHIAIQLFDHSDEVVSEAFVKIVDGTAYFSVEDLVAGEYSVRYFHDENDNKEMDTNMFGYPKEGYGFSNNAHGMIGPPCKDKRSFSLVGSKSLSLTIKYL